MRRLAQPTDFDEVFAIYMDPSVVPFLGYDPMSKAEFRPVFEKLLGSGSFYVHEESGEILGFIKAFLYEGRCAHVGYLGSLAVSPKAQGRGVGRSMVSDAISMLRERRALRIELLVESDNPRAIRFYEQLGFAREGLLKKFYKRAHESHYIDEVLMAIVFDE